MSTEYLPGPAMKMVKKGIKYNKAHSLSFQDSFFRITKAATIIVMASGIAAKRVNNPRIINQEHKNSAPTVKI